MKLTKVIVSLLTVFFFTISPLVVASTSPLDGVWKLVSAKHKYEKREPFTVLKLGEQFYSYKIVSNGYYSVLTQDVSRNVFGANMGTFEVEGDKYTEHFIIHKDTNSVNGKYAFTYRLENNQWFIHSDDIIEVWEKVAPTPLGKVIE